MSETDDNKPATPEQVSNVVEIVDARIQRMRERGHLISMYEEFEILRIKFIYDDLKDRQDAIRFMTLLKYFMENGPSEAMRLNCKYMYERYVKKAEQQQPKG